MTNSQETSHLGQRQTRQRDAICQVIEDTSGPLAAEKIHQYLALAQRHAWIKTDD